MKNSPATRADYSATFSARRDLFALFSESPAPICVMRGPELIVELANAACLEVWGKDETVLGKPLLDGLPELRGQEFDELARGVLRSGFAYHGHRSRMRLDRKHDGTLDEVYFDYVCSPLHDAKGEIDRVVTFATDVTQQVHADRSRAFLAEATAVLVSSLDYEKTLGALARLCVPTVADFAAIDVKQADGSIRRLAIAHVDPKKIELVHRIAERIPSRLGDERGIGRVIRTSESAVIRRIRDDAIAESVRDPETLEAVRSLGLVSSICVPIRIDGAAIGALSLVTAESGREYVEGDVRLAEELALRAAGAIKNATLYSESIDAIRQQETRFQLFVESVTDYAIFMLDPQGHIASWNRGAERLKGYRADEILGKHFSVFYPRTDVEAGKCERELETAVHEGRFEEEGWRIRKDGSTFWASVTITAIRDREGRLQGFGKVTRDLTARVRAARERMFYELVENIPELAWTARPDGYIDFYNRRWFEYTGTTLEEMQGWGWRSVHDPAMLEAVTERWDHSLQTGEPFEMEFPLRGADGTFQWFLTRVRPYRDSEGRVVRWFGTNTNIDERRRSDTFRDLFIGILGHDLRNPLNTIMMTASMMSMRGELSPENESMLARLIASGVRIQRMIDQLLDMTRARLAGGIPITRSGEQDVVPIVMKIIDELRTAHPRGAIHLLADGPCMASVDADRIEQVVSNLVTNAIAHGEPNKPVSVRVTEDDQAVRIRVHNHGEPIDPSFVPLLFNPFARKEKRGRSDGLGLGLYIAEQIVAAHGGTIEVESSPETGTRFDVTLPK